MKKFALAALISLFVIALSITTFAVISERLCLANATESADFAPKDHCSDTKLLEGMHPAPAPAGPAETDPPAGPITVDQDLNRFDGFTGTVMYWDKTANYDQLIGIQVTREGYMDLLDGIGYKEVSLPSTVYLSRFSVESIGYGSDDPTAKFVLVME